MSGLAVRFHRDRRPVDPAAIWEMLAAVPYRGIDGNAVRSWDVLALGHAKLTVTPEEVAEQQPLVSPDTGCAVIADVRLDNRQELLDRLDRGLPASISDAELILHAWEAWGTGLVDRLLGDFAFVIWDPRHRQVVCARDTSGQRTLFYRLDHGTFVAASEIQQILRDPSVEIAVNDERIMAFLTPQNMFRNEPQLAETFYRDIMLLPPGHLLIVNEETHLLARFWELRPGPEIRYRRDDAYAEHLRELLFTCVRGRLRGVQPVCALLSGGLDSSSIVCTAQELYRAAGAGNGGLIGFSLVFDGLDCDEQPFIEAIQAKYGFETRLLPAETFAGRLRAAPRGFMESPNMGVGAERDRLYGAIQATGVRVVLTGDIADGCVGGTWLVFDSLLRQGRVRDLYRHIRAYRQAIDPSWRRVGLYTLAPLLPIELQRSVMVARKQRQLGYIQRLLMPDWMPEPLRVELAQRAADGAIEAERERRFANETRQHEYRTLYPPTVARHPAPWSLQIARPFADRRLHEFLLAIPPEQKFSIDPAGGSPYARSKWVLRRAMEGILPEEVRTRTTKTVFGQVTEDEISRQWPLYEEVFGPAATSELARRGYVDPDRFWDRLRAARDGAGGTDMVYLMQMIGLETWLRTFSQSRPEHTTIPPPMTDMMSAATRPVTAHETAIVP